MDWVFPPPSVNRLARKNNNRSGQSSEEKPVEDHKFKRQNQQVLAKNHENNEKTQEKEENESPSRYWANKRIQAIKKQQE